MSCLICQFGNEYAYRDFVDNYGLMVDMMVMMMVVMVMITRYNGGGVDDDDDDDENDGDGDESVARDAVRVIRHGPELSISESDLNDFFVILLRLLDEVYSLTHDDNLMEAVARIRKLQSNTLPIAIADINRIFDDGIKQMTTVVPKEMVQIGREAIEKVSEVRHKTMHEMHGFIDESECKMRDLHQELLHEQRHLHEEMNQRMRKEFEIKREKIYEVADVCQDKLQKKADALLKMHMLSTESSIKEHREIQYDKGKTFVETEITLSDAMIEIKECGQKEREKIAQFAQDQIEIIKSQQTSQKHFNETKQLQRMNFETGDKTSLLDHEEYHRNCEEMETETDMLKQIYEKVPVTVLLETAKCNLPQDDYISYKDLENVISNSSHQWFSSVFSMKEEEILVKSRTHKEPVSAEISPTQMEKEQGISSEDGIQNKCIVCKDRKKSSIILPCRHFVTCLDCLRKQTACPLCRGAIKEVYIYQDVVDEQNLQDAPSDEINYVDQTEQTEDREEYDTYLQRRYLRKHTVRSMKKGIFPDQRLLNELCLEFGRKSKFLVQLCYNISEHIKALDENILHVWAAYTVKDRNKITFVVVVKENVRLEKTIQYSFVKRVVNEYSLEAEHVMYNNKEVSIDQHDLQSLKTSISNHATELMRKHKYLSIISGSSVRSRNYGIDQADAVNLVEQPCIVLYVHTKHFIPIEEEPFEELYDGVPVDVREGEFFPYMFATDHHDRLRHSCQIGSSPDRSPNDNNRLSGSLGCFIDHPEYNLCGLTCAHVLLFPWGLEKVKRNENGTLRWPSFKPHDIVYQPADSNEAIGQIVQVIYQEGGNNSCGLEVALFQIDQRQPIAGNFPTMRNAGGDEESLFDSGKSCGFSHIGDDEAIKFGPVTDKTTGRFELETHTTCVRTISEYWDYDQFRITLNNQLCVKSTDSNGQPKPFAAKGDSGSLVFIKDSCGELVSVGIVEGGTSYGATIVTPIKPILQRIGVHSIKSFEKEKIEQKLDNIDNRLQSITEYLEQKLGGNK
ncbi:uncharacterized protein LOC123527103 [Mercenaria mercenaria]|uniref:uncharacterized protein LOC123527103 n=1 Tax=Mercenaria mercenaria TaxID=6596 RepID=UPI00234E5253|nr:uncharacterized protein LOC123527103 [Mercenaria mercenaria]